MGLEQQVGQERRGLHRVCQFDQHPEGERIVNDRLADVEHADSAAGQDGGQRMRDPGMVVTGDIDVKDTCLRRGGHGEHTIIVVGRSSLAVRPEAPGECINASALLLT